MKILIAAMLSSIWLLCGCGALVGGECAEGYEQSAGQCILGVDRQSAGGVGASGSSGSGGAGGAAAGTGGSSGSTTESGGGGHITVSAATSASTSSSASTSGGGGSGGGFSCDPPLVDCGGACVDTTSDPSNCSQCGVVCPTDLCVMSACVGSLAGHVIVVGMDYEKATLGAPPCVLLGNAVFLAPHEPLRLLEYRQFTSATQIGNVKIALASEASKRSRTVVTTTAPTAAALPSILATGGVDVVLVEHQSIAPPGTLGPIGAEWASAFSQFTKQGGVVVVLASDAGTGEMTDLLTQSNLLSNGGSTTRTGEDLFNQGMLDAIGAGVLSPFLAKKSTVSFVGVAPPSPTFSFVVTSADGAPIVVHRVVQGP